MASRNGLLVDLENVVGLLEHLDDGRIIPSDLVHVLGDDDQMVAE